MAPSEKDRGGTAAALEHQNELLRKENEKLKLREQQYNSILETMTEAVERDSADLIIIVKVFIDLYKLTLREP